MIDVNHVPAEEPLKIMVGAGQQRWDGWIPTGKEHLDLTRRED